MIVVAVAGTLMAVAIPRFAEFNNRRDLRSAKMRLINAVATARQGAIQRGATTRLHVHASRVRVTRNGVVVGLVAPLDTLYKVTVTVVPSTADHFDYDARGFARGLATRVKYRLTRAGAPSDSICVSKLGMIQKSCDLP